MADLSTRQESVDDLTAPESTAPEETTPQAIPEKAISEETAPEEATVEEATPEVATPAVATAEVATPEVATPEVATASVATAEETTPEGATEPARPAPRRLSRWAALVTGLSALLVALLVGAVVLLAHNHGVSQRATQRQAVIDAAKTVITDLTTLGKDDPQQHVAGLLQQSTGAFRDQLAGSSEEFQAGVKAAGLESTGIVTAVGLENLESDTATALVTVSTATVDDQTPQGKLQDFHLAVGLQRDGDRWLAATVDYLP